MIKKKLQKKVGNREEAKLGKMTNQNQTQTKKETEGKSSPDQVMRVERDKERNPVGSLLTPG